MRRFLTLLLLLPALCCCHSESQPQAPEGIEFERGADIGWITEMEQKGYKFYDASGKEMECTALMKQLGCTAIRHRVWVNPTDGWCGAEDLLIKARRAHILGLKLMIDFHYSDWWADPGKQNIPSAWKDYDAPRMAIEVANHTKETLKLLKDNGINVEWVQIGNEVNTGMLWPVGEVRDNDATNFVSFLNAGYQAAKEVYPDIKVILHHSNAQDLGAIQWFYDLVSKQGGKFDIIGLSLYPSYWSEQENGYPDWKPYCENAVNNVKTLHERYSKPVMMVEFGMPASEPAKSAEALQFVIDGTRDFDWFGGIFYWEPESERSRNGYDYGAFADGRPTSALNPFTNFKGKN